MGNYLYLLGGAFVVFGLGRNIVVNSVRGRDFHGQVNVGNNAASKPDVIAWLIAIVGVLIAAGQFAHELLHPK